MAELTRWVAGLDQPSMGVFLKVVDILIEHDTGARFNPIGGQ